MGSLDPKMLTNGNFKETYGKLNYEILLLTASNTIVTAHIYIFSLESRFSLWYTTSYSAKVWGRE